MFGVSGRVVGMLAVGSWLLLCPLAARADSIMSLGKLKSSTTAGPAVAPGMTGTACGFVSGGQAGPFGSLGTPALTAGACPTTPLSVTIKEVLSDLGVSTINGFTSRGGTLAKATPQAVSVQWRRLGGTGFLATGFGAWDTLGNATIGTPAGTVTYNVSADGGLSAGVIYAGTGLAEDPFDLGPGSYEHQPRLDDLSLFTDVPGGLASVMFGFDSTEGPLWTLDIFMTEPGSATVDFTSFPALVALGLSLDDAAVESTLAAALGFSASGALTLNAPDSLFPAGSSITLSRTTTFSEWAVAYAGPQPVPEPSTIALLGAGLAALALRRSRSICAGALKKVICSRFAPIQS